MLEPPILFLFLRPFTDTILHSHTVQEADLKNMYKKFVKALDNEDGVKSHDEFFLLAPSFALFDLLVR